MHKCGVWSVVSGRRSILVIAAGDRAQRQPLIVSRIIFWAPHPKTLRMALGIFRHSDLVTLGRSPAPRRKRGYPCAAAKGAFFPNRLTAFFTVSGLGCRTL